MRYTKSNEILHKMEHDSGYKYLGWFYHKNVFRKYLPYLKSNTFQIFRGERYKDILWCYIVIFLKFLPQKRFL